MRAPIVLHSAALVTALLMACGQPVLMNTVAAMNDKTDDFDGNWVYKRGTVKERCSGQGSTTTQLEDSGVTIHLNAGSNGQLEAKFRGCSWDYDVSGAEAFARPDQDCRYTDESGTVLSISLEDSVLSIDGKELTQDETIFHVRYKDNTGSVSRECTETWAGDLKKAPRGTGTTSGGIPGTSSSSSSSTGGGTLCTNTCSYFGDGYCDDGGPNSDYSVCELGTDCTDCGVR